jgi:hypothetical protein
MCPESHFTSISGRGKAPFWHFVKKSKSLYPTAQPKLGPPCHHCFATELPQLCMWCTVYNYLWSLFFTLSYKYHM